ncbi:hypothetical protein [Psychroserpens sp. NJDZ02]
MCQCENNNTLQRYFFKNFSHEKNFKVYLTKWN